MGIERYYLLILLLVPILISISMTDDVSAITYASIPEGTGVPGCEVSAKCFLPYYLRVDVGDQVIWLNMDTAVHTVTSGNPTDGPDGNFDSSLFMSGAEFSHTFDAAGEYPYFCMVHPWMIGVVSVQVTTSTFGQMQNSIVVTTDKASYSDGDTIRITGSISTLNENYPVPVTILLVDSTGNIVSVAQVMPNFAGDYSHSIIAGGTMKTSGDYEIRVQYGAQKSSITFSFTASGYTPPPIPSPPIPTPTPTPIPTPTPTPIPTPTPTPIPTPTPTPFPSTRPSPPDDIFPIVYVAIAVAIAAAAGIGIGLSKRKKVAPVISTPPAKAQVRQSKDDTQFWVCPNCGNDTQMKDGRQYCFSCKIYLSI